ncbi:MAG: c-type cytochrome [Spongiibacteraceae bacterium]
MKGKLVIAHMALVFSISAFANEQLMSKAGCVACHRVDQKVNGPAFKAVATRYKNDPSASEYLFEKVREGGEGVWGDLPMIPNSKEKISDADLHGLISWILTL